MVGGFFDNEFDVEIVDLSNQNRTCPKPSNYPVEMGSVGTFINNEILICGGGKYCGESTVTFDCYTYDVDNDSWNATIPMFERRSCAASLMLSTGDWWIAGGATATFNSMYAIIYS